MGQQIDDRPRGAGRGCEAVKRTVFRRVSVATVGEGCQVPGAVTQISVASR